MCGKFDQHAAKNEETSSIYSPFVDAFTQYLDKVASSGEETVQAVKQTIENALGDTELLVIRDMMPAVAKITGDGIKQNNVFTERSPVIRGPEAEKRFGYIFGTFVQAIGLSSMTPIILFMDDIHWAHRSALHLVASLACAEKRNPGPRIMLICTYRPDEVSEDHSLSDMFRGLKDSGVLLTEVEVSRLTEPEVNELITLAFDLRPAKSEQLAGVVYRRTEGNMLFAVMFVDSLVEEGVVSRNNSGHWQWEYNPIIVRDIHSVSNLIVRKINKLSEVEQELIKTASCLGSTFSVTTLGYLDIVVAARVAPTLMAIQEVGLISFNSDTGTGRFTHDKFQQAIYNLLSESVRPTLHLQIGRRLWKALSPSLRDDNLLLIADQISRGVDFVDDAREKIAFAEMFYWAGQKAAILSAFPASAAFLNLGISLLRQRNWKDNYDLSFRLYCFAAEIEYYNGNLHRVDELVEVVLGRARSLDDKLRAQFTRIYSLQSRNENATALHESLNFLEDLGETIPRQPRTIHLLASMVRCKLMLRWKSDDSILRIPPMTDTRRIASMRMLLLAALAAFFVNEKLAPLLFMRLAINTLRYGMNDVGKCTQCVLPIAVCSELTLLCMLLPVKDVRRLQDLVWFLVSDCFPRQRYIMSNLILI